MGLLCADMPLSLRPWRVRGEYETDNVSEHLVCCNWIINAWQTALDQGLGTGGAISDDVNIISWGKPRNDITPLQESL